jgi:hypothetical protein
MDDRQDQRLVSLLFTDWWQDTNLAIANLKNGLIRISVLVSHQNPMQPPDSHIAHFVSNRMVSVSGEAIKAGSHQKMRPNLLRDAEQFIDVALSVADMHTSLRLIRKFSGLPQILEPSDTFIFSMGTRVGLIFLLSAAVPLNFSLVQNLTAHSPSGSPSVVIARLECINIPHAV